MTTEIARARVSRPLSRDFCGVAGWLKGAGGIEGRKRDVMVQIKEAVEIKEVRVGGLHFEGQKCRCEGRGSWRRTGILSG